MGKVNIYDFGGGGNNLVKNPLQVADNETTQTQNAELIPDADKGGEGALSKRGGLATLTSALGATIMGMIGLPLQTTYTKTLLASLMTADSNRFRVTSNGTSYANLDTPNRAFTKDQLDQTEIFYRAGFRGAAFGGQIYYPSNNYTLDVSNPESSGTAPPMNLWDGTNAVEVFTVPAGLGPAGYHSHGITDMLTANGKIYFCTYDPQVTLRGRVFEFNPKTGVIRMVARPFGDSTGEQSGGFPVCLAMHNGQLFVGCNEQSGSSGGGQIVRCFPDIATAWTVDSTTMGGDVCSLKSYKGLLYAGLRAGSIGSNVFVAVRSNAGTWATSYSNASSGLAFGTGLEVFNDELYALEYQDTATDIMHIKKFDGTTWTTDRDVDALDGWNKDLIPGNVLTWESALYAVWTASAVGASDGFILRKSGGTWTKVETDNFGGLLLPLTIRS